MANYLTDLWYSIESCLTCFQSPTLKINRRSFKIVKLLGEVCVHYVYFHFHLLTALVKNLDFI